MLSLSKDALRCRAHHSRTATQPETVAGVEQSLATDVSLELHVNRARLDERVIGLTRAAT
jgi:hypothetical protein